MKRTLLASSIIALLLVQAAIAQDSLNISQVASLAFDWDYASDLKVVGNYAFVADGQAGLRVMDVSNASSPVQVSSLILPGGAYNLALSGETVFIRSTAGYYTVDVSEPRNPRQLVPIDSLSRLRAIATDGQGYLYLAQSTVQENFLVIHVIEVSNPLQAHEVNRFDVRGSYTGQLFYVNEKLYVFSASTITIVDIRGNAESTEISAINGEFQAMLVDGRELYVLFNYDSLRVYNFPEGRPVIVGRYGEMWGLGYEILAKVGDYLIAGSRILDVSNVHNIQDTGYYYTQSNRWEVIGTTAYSASGTYGFETYDLTDLPNVTRLGGYCDPSGVSEVEIVGHYALVHSDIGIEAIDIADPSHPRRTRRISGWGRPMVAANGLLYTGGLNIYDPTDPTALVGLGGIEGYGRSLAVSGRYAAAEYTGEWDTLKLIDVLHPARPAIVRTALLGTTDPMIAFAGEYLLRAGWGGLGVFDFHQPDDSLGIAMFRTEGSISALAGKDSLAFVGLRGQDDEGAFQILSLANPTHLREIGYIQLPGVPNRIELWEGSALVSCGNSGIAVIDIIDVRHPSVVGYYNTTGVATDAAVRNGFAFVAEGNSFGVYDCGRVLGVEQQPAPAVPHLILEPAYPNPFNSETSLRFAIPSGESFQLGIYDLTGRLVTDLIPNTSSSVIWRADGYSSGSYIARLSTGNTSVSRQITLVR